MPTPTGISRRKRRAQVPGFSPLNLFAASEVGLWYDPSDLTPEKLAWRRNQFTWSEDATVTTNDAWFVVRTSIGGNVTVAPDGAQTADRLTEDSATGVHYVEKRNNTLTNGLAYTVSLFIKADSTRNVALNFSGGGGPSALFNPTTGVALATSATNASNLTTASVNAGNGWYRVSMSFVWTGTTASTIGARFYLHNANTLTDIFTGYAGDGTSGAFIWGAQLELAPTASSYQRITDFSSDFLAAFPTHTLYQNSTGTTPVTALGQPVGLVIDKSKGGLAALGPELVSNPGPFTVTTGWSGQNGLSLSVSNGALIADCSTATGSPRVSTPITCVVGRGYWVSMVINRNAGMAATTNNVSVSAAAGLTSAIASSSTTSVTGSNVTLWVFFVATATTMYVGVTTSALVSSSFSILSATTREIPGVHATQATDAARPTLQARANLLTYSEQFDNAAWTKSNATVTANATTAPDGTTTADLITPTTTGLDRHLKRTTTIFSGQSYVHTIYAKANGINFIYFSDINDSVNNVWFNLTNGTTSTPSVGTASMQNMGDGWWRCVQITTSSSTTGTYFFALADSSGSRTSTASGTNGVYVWGADLRLGTSAGTYQRVVTATDYADVGLPRSLTFDGTDDSLVTPSVNFTATDKMTVCAGVFKNANPTAINQVATVAELSAAVGANNGAFLLSAFNSFLSPSYGTFGYESKGSGAQQGANTTDTAFNAPVSVVVTGNTDIGAGTLTLRMNSTLVSTNTSGMGSGNFGTYQLFIGRRNQTSNPLNGRIHQLIVRGAATDTATIQQTERFVATKTGVTLP